MYSGTTVVVCSPNAVLCQLATLRIGSDNRQTDVKITGGFRMCRRPLYSSRTLKNKKRASNSNKDTQQPRRLSILLVGNKRHARPQGGSAVVNQVVSDRGKKLPRNLIVLLILNLCMHGTRYSIIQQQQRGRPWVYLTNVHEHRIEAAGQTADGPHVGQKRGYEDLDTDTAASSQTADRQNNPGYRESPGFREKPSVRKIRRNSAIILVLLLVLCSSCMRGTILYTTAAVWQDSGLSHINNTGSSVIDSSRNLECDR